VTITYEDASTSSVVAGPGVAQSIAEEAGLGRGSSPDDILRWERPALP
jgi:hypothetical protein